MSGTTEKVYPMVLVFYLDREMMKNQEITQAFAESVNELINVKNFNAIAFFLPTDGEERIECINPLIAPKEKMEQIDKMIKDISKNFGIGEEITFTEVESVIPNTITPVINSQWDYSEWRKNNSDGPYTQHNWNQTLITKINQVSAQIYKFINHGANRIIINQRLLDIFETLEYYHKKTSENNEISNHAGSLSGRYIVILDESITEDKIYLAYANPEIDLKNISEITILNYPEDIF